jgi:hypothetical protein
MTRFGFAAMLLLLTALPAHAQPALVSAVLPSSRSVQVGQTATAFATVINTANTPATGCSIAPLTVVPATFLFQTTDPATNLLTGTPNQPVTIPATSGNVLGFQTFLIAFTFSAPFGTTNLEEVQLTFDCGNTDPAEIVSGVNTLALSASSTPTPDIVALAATVKNDGIVDIPGTTGTGFFAVATVNVGTGAMIRVTADSTVAELAPSPFALCPTDAQGNCTKSLAPSQLVQINAGQTASFTIFVTGADTVAFDPAHNRVFVRFQELVAGPFGLMPGPVRGSTSVAVRTAP